MASIESLTSLVTTHSARLSDLIASKSHPKPTFVSSNASRYAGEDAELRSARQDLARAAQDLASLAQSPEDHILSLAWSSADTANLAVVLRFSLPQLVPLDSSISARELAIAANLPEDIVNRTMRYAVGNGIFFEGPKTGMFKHNASSALLARNEHLRNIAVEGTTELSYILLRLADALELQQQARKQQKMVNGSRGMEDGVLLSPEDIPAAAFNVAYPEYHNVFDWLSKNPESAGRYHRYMSGRHNTPRWEIGNLISAYDWASVKDQTVVDVSTSCIALYSPSFRFIETFGSEELSATRPSDLHWKQYS